MSSNEARIARPGVQYQNLEHQASTAIAGMWLFLTTEVMFFGGAIATYVIYGYMYPEVWVEYSHHLQVPLGTVNTAVLLTSSLLVALAVKYSRRESLKGVSWLLVATAILGLVFLVIKGFEWHHEFEQGLFPGAWSQSGNGEDKGKLYFSLYFALTGLHAFHVTIGVGLLFWLAYRIARKRITFHYNAQIEIIGLYWHFVDVVWIFLFPMLYLVDRSA